MVDHPKTYGRDAIPEIAALLKDIDLCHMASRGENGELHARPMSNNGQVEWDGVSWFFAPGDGRLADELRADPSVVTAYAGEDYAFVSISGRVTIEQDVKLKKEHWISELERWFPNGPEDPNVLLLRVEADRAEWWTKGGDGAADLREA